MIKNTLAIVQLENKTIYKRQYLDFTFVDQHPITRSLTSDLQEHRPTENVGKGRIIEGIFFQVDLRILCDQNRIKPCIIPENQNSLGSGCFDK